MKDINQQIHQILNEIVPLLIDNNITIGTAESCTGGLLGHTFTNISGSSTFFERGIISYSNQAKMELLDVSSQDLKIFGAVSKQVAKAMAEGIKKKAQVSIGLSTTGIAGPTGGTKEKPVGLVYIGLAGNDETIVKKCNFDGSRIENKYSTILEILLLLKKYLTN
jgi:nicotinamide-nucleotide amidase